MKKQNELWLNVTVVRYNKVFIDVISAEARDDLAISDLQAALS